MHALVPQAVAAPHGFARPSRSGVDPARPSVRRGPKSVPRSWADSGRSWALRTTVPPSGPGRGPRGAELRQDSRRTPDPAPSRARGPAHPPRGWPASQWCQPDPSIRGVDTSTRRSDLDPAATKVDGWKVHGSLLEFAKYLRRGGPIGAEALLLRVVAVPQTARQSTREHTSCHQNGTRHGDIFPKLPRPATSRVRSEKRPVLQASGRARTGGRAPLHNRRESCSRWRRRQRHSRVRSSRCLEARR
jgi:hypothetical protein